MASIEINKVTSFVTASLSGRSVIASCLPGADHSLSLVSIPQVTGVVGGVGVSGVVSERPTKAPMARATQAFGYALAAAGAERRRPGANGSTAVVTQQHKMWAIRGLEPWRDPA